MSDRVFVDTNVLVYAVEAEGLKGQASRALLREDGICLSTQVLAEFYVVVTRHNRTPPLTHDEATAWIQLWKRYPVHPITSDEIDLALELKARFQLSYFDAQILASASLAGCEVVLSEDMNAGQAYGRVTVINPYAPAGS